MLDSELTQEGLTYPQSMYSIHMIISPELLGKAPWKVTMFGLLQSCMI